MNDELKPYPVYKDTGVPWLGQVPEHWEVKRLKFGAAINPSRTEIRNLPSNLEVSFFSMEAVGYGELYEGQIKHLQDVSGGFTYFRDNDVLIAKITPSFENGKGALASELSNGIGFGTTELHVIRPSDKLDKKFLFYFTYSHEFRHPGEGMMDGTAGQKRIPNDFLIDYRIAIPPLPEQTAIADYLDRKTAQIDAVIAKKERLIELLREERTALISQAVTKGLNPAAPMKDSGVAWLGQVPEHWSVENLKWLANVGLSNVDKKTKENEPDVELCNYVDVYYNEEITRSINFMQATASQSQIDRLSLESGDVLITKDSETPDDIAVPAYVPKTLPGVVCGYHLAHIRPHRTKLDGMYLFRSFQANGIKDQFEFSANGITRFGISKYTIENALILVPPLPEQTAIAAYLDQKTSEIDQTIARTETQIVRLREYRTALISAVVTGKVDVRQEAAP